MNRIPLLALACAAVFASCGAVATKVRGGYMQMDVAGSVTLDDSNGGPAAGGRQDIGSAFGLGDEHGSPFLRADVDCGGPSFTASGFWFEDDGTGVLDDDFGGLLGNTPVTSEIELGNLRLGAVWDFELGPVTLSPGLALDLFDFHFRASDPVGNSEVIDEFLAVPLLVARGSTRVGPVDLLGEVGYIEASNGEGSTNRFLDADVMLSCTVSSSAFVFAGYRFIDVDATGDTEAQSFTVDLELRGWYLGGGIAF